MNTTINIDVQTKKQAQQIAQELGLSLSSIIKGYLRQFVRTKEVHLSIEGEEPSDYLLEMLRESEADVKAGRVISFDNPGEELAHIDALILADEEANKDK